MAAINLESARIQLEQHLLDAMTQAAFYPHACQSVEPVQTLTAWLLFAGDFVYKVKKAIHLSFIDARTPAKRYRLCHDEVLLNRRLAPEVYVGIAGIKTRSGRYSLIPNATLSQPGVREFAIVMHRLPTERMLSQMVADQTIGLIEIQQLAAQILTFHRRCPIAQSKMWGSALALSRLIAGAVAETEALIADTLMRIRLTAATKYLRGYLLSNQPLLDGRTRNGHVRDGHGDLRAASVCLVPQALAIIGCVEYSESWRYCDAASELASVMLDLEIAGRNDLSDGLVQAYVAASADAEITRLMPFYKCYRAVRRGQLEMLMSLQTEMPRERRMLARHYASDWFELASKIAGGRATS